MKRKDDKQVLGQWPNLMRMIEIALFGGFSINLISSEENFSTAEANARYIEDYFSEFDIFTAGSPRLYFELYTPTFESIIGFFEGRFESVPDMLKRIEGAKQNPPVGGHLNEACKVLLKNGYEKLNFSVNDVDVAIKVAAKIAQLDGYDRVEAQHIAEAIQYRVKPENAKRV